jgi:hypothetical protein
VQKKQKAGDAYQDAVANLAREIFPQAYVTVGVWVDGPDGRRDLDVLIELDDNGVHKRVVIECKDWNRPIGIALIDALDSKRQDLDVSLVMICSNSGFTSDALRKASRVGIPTLSALAEKNKLIRVVVREQIYTRIIEFVEHSPLIHHKALPIKRQEKLQHPQLRTQEWTFNNGCLESWVSSKLLTLYNAIESSECVLVHRFRKDLMFRVRGVFVPVSGIDIQAKFKVQWMTQTVIIDASSGIYDYFRKTVIHGLGSYRVMVKKIDTESWGSTVELCDVPSRYLTFLKERKDLQMPETSMSFTSFKNFPESDPKFAPNIDEFVIEEKLLSKIEYVDFVKTNADAERSEQTKGSLPNLALSASNAFVTLRRLLMRR